MISIEETTHIGKLANLSLSNEELAKLQESLSEALDYVSILDGLDISPFSATSQVTGLTNVFRDDSKAMATLSLEKALANARKVKNNMFETRLALSQA
ncbi:Asp-tRNA(Asn)/Glu-tRNA(Gln) amidotransferase GatCAB subunit C [candidate division WWE3 bacterium CG_4_10_14_0_2_um_filter_42_7]|uniref:Asp-tRNA(Asn)/Glu-tRNA(Gln) amidotransferase GatCAB subunit C n=2 Tax=Katanobacteria TaxID=422282 RepID=A0A2H0XBZ0_UNCKA|nr:MAG: Asp-tRNA(Asn)/Glu-tRNA(Gln) amidotransferase GatCAB subunit C [candidate division WWE3 bacterium CG08_land_8_20_14_0_20_41_15]PIZ43782.1 MAG: Asp-tRNA(Asn)/Glu-tRNA(Gln) amidotransferase GatCAB subunit C [candidate division WWE3 bacterium CG_4_10_14_0_2_um_filter_42_7]